MLSRFRAFYEIATLPLGKACLKLGLKPDHWTLFSVFTSIVTGAVLAQGGRELTEKVEGPGYGALVAAMNRAVTHLSFELAQEIGRIRP